MTSKAMFPEPIRFFSPSIGHRVDLTMGTVDTSENYVNVTRPETAIFHDNGQGAGEYQTREKWKVKELLTHYAFGIRIFCYRVSINNIQEKGIEKIMQELALPEVIKKPVVTDIDEVKKLKEELLRIKKELAATIETSTASARVTEAELLKNIGKMGQKELHKIGKELTPPVKVYGVPLPKARKEIKDRLQNK